MRRSVRRCPVRLPVPGPLAQLVEQGTLNPKVVGSIPTRPIRWSDSAGVLEGSGERVDVRAVVVAMQGHANAVASRADHDVVLLGKARLHLSGCERGMAEREDVTARTGVVEVAVRRPAPRGGRGDQL